jgi:hypothetical protein
MYRIRIPVYKDQVFSFFFPILVNEFIFTLNLEASFKNCDRWDKIGDGWDLSKKVLPN